MQHHPTELVARDDVAFDGRIASDDRRLRAVQHKNTVPVIGKHTRPCSVDPNIVARDDCSEDVHAEKPYARCPIPGDHVAFARGVPSNLRIHLACKKAHPIGLIAYIGEARAVRPDVVAYDTVAVRDGSADFNAAVTVSRDHIPRCIGIAANVIALGTTMDFDPNLAVRERRGPRVVGSKVTAFDRIPCRRAPADLNPVFKAADDGSLIRF